MLVGGDGVEGGTDVRQVARGAPEVGEDDVAPLAYAEQRRLAAELQEDPRLAEPAQHLGRGAQGGEGDPFARNVAREGRSAVRAEGEHLYAARADLVVPVAELTELLAAVGSEKAAQEDDQARTALHDALRCPGGTVLVDERKFRKAHCAPPSLSIGKVTP